MDICPATDSIRWGGSPKFKNMRLAIPVTSRQTMDDSQKNIPQNIYVHKLKIDIDSTRIYAHTIKPEDYEKGLCIKSSAVYTGGDSLVFSFTEEFAKPLFDLDSVVMDSTALFIEKFKGIYMDCDRADVVGGRLNNLDLNNAVLTFSFNSENYAGHRRDTTVYFYVGASACVLDVDQDHLIPESELCEEKAYYDGLTGIKPVIKAVKLREFADSLAKEHKVEAKAVMVSKAQFEFPFEYPGSYDAYATWPSNMYLCRRLRDTTGIIYYSPISEIYASIYDVGDMNRSTMAYCPDAALYIQSLLNVSKEEIDNTYDLWLMPTISMTSTSTSSYSNYYSYYYYYYYGYDPYSSSSSTTYYYVDNMNYQNCVLNGPKAQRRPKLRITFTILK